MSVDSRYFIQPIANNGGVKYTFEMESIGAESLEVYSIAEPVVPTTKTLIPPEDYTVIFGYRDPINTRGTIVLSLPLADGESLQIQRNTPITNDHIFAPSKPFEAETFEFAIDKMTFILQELEGTLCDCRTTKTTPGYTPDPNDPHDTPGPEPFYLCSALFDYITALTDVFAYGIFANNKASLNSVTYDETGQGNTWLRNTDINTLLLYLDEGNTTGVCEEGLAFQYAADGSASLMARFPGPDIPYTKNGSISGGVVLRISITTLITPQPLIALGAQRGSSLMVAIDPDHKLYVADAGLVQVDYFSPEIIVPLNTDLFISLAINVVTGDYEAIYNGVKKSGTNPNGQALPYSSGAFAGFTDTTDAGRGKYITQKVGWAIDAYNSGDLAYQAYLRTIQQPILPDLQPTFLATISSWQPHYFWLTDEASGAIIDSAGRKDLAAQGSSTYQVTDIMNEVGTIDIGGDSNFTGSNALGMGMENMTLGIWVEIGSLADSSGVETILQLGNVYNDRAWRFYIDRNNDRLVMENQTNGLFSLTSDNVIDTTEGVRLFIVMRHKNYGPVDFFVNGVLVGTGIGFHRIYPQGGANIYLGALANLSNSSYISGSLSKPFVIPHLVPDERILDMYNKGKL